MQHLPLHSSGTGLALTLALASPAGFAVDPPASPPNAAEGYRAAFALWDALPVDLRQRLADATGDPAVFAGSVPSLAADLAAARPTLEAFLAATAVETCDWELDRSEGFAMLLPHLAPMRSLTRLASLEATAALADGDARRAAGALEAISRGTTHLAADPVLIDSLVAGTMLSTVARSAASAIDAGLVDPALAGTLLDLVPERAAPVLGLERAMRGEVDAVAAEFDRIAGGGDAFTPELAALLGGEGADRMRSLDLFEEIADEATAAMAETDPARRLELVEALEARIESLPEDDSASRLVRLLVPSYGSVARSIDRIDADLAAVRTRLEAIAGGEGDLADANAAYWYLRTTPRLRSIPPRAQVALELERLAPDAVDAAMGEEVADWLARLEDAEVLATLREAATIDRCDFTFGDDRRRSASDVLLHGAFPAIRAGARVLIVSAGRDLREAASIDGDGSDEAIAEIAALRARAASSLAAAISIARHLAIDGTPGGTPGGTITAASICTEIADALAALPLEGADLEPVERAIARLPRAAPLGPLGADAADRTIVEIVLRDLGFDQAINRARVAEDAGSPPRRPASKDAALRGLAALGEVPPTLQDADEAPMHAADDLVDMDLWRQWRTLANERRARPVEGPRFLERLVIVGEIPTEADGWARASFYRAVPRQAAMAAIDRLDRWTQGSRSNSTDE